MNQQSIAKGRSYIRLTALLMVLVGLAGVFGFIDMIGDSASYENTARLAGAWTVTVLMALYLPVGVVLYTAKKRAWYAALALLGIVVSGCLFFGVVAIVLDGNLAGFLGPWIMAMLNGALIGLLVNSSSRAAVFKGEADPDTSPEGPRTQRGEAQ